MTDEPIGQGRSVKPTAAGPEGQWTAEEAIAFALADALKDGILAKGPPMTDEMTVPTKEYLALHREAGLARGILRGWMAWDGTPEHMARLKSVTREFIDGEGHD